MTAVEFVGELPKIEGRRGDHGPRKATLEMLRAIHKRQGEWAITDDVKKSSTFALKKRYGIDVAVRTVDGETKVYVRWPRAMRVPECLEGLL